MMRQLILHLAYLRPAEDARAAVYGLFRESAERTGRAQSSNPLIGRKSRAVVLKDLILSLSIRIEFVPNIRDARPPERWAPILAWAPAWMCAEARETGGRTRMYVLQVVCLLLFSLLHCEDHINIPPYVTHGPH